MDQAAAWRAANPDERAPWFGGWDAIGVVMAGQSIVYDASLSPGIYEVVAVDRFAGRDHVVTVVRVADD